MPTPLPLPSRPPHVPRRPRVACLTRTLAACGALALAACGGGETSVGPRLTCPALRPPPGSGTGIVPGSGSLTMSGGAVRSGRSAAYEEAAASAFSVVDVHTDDSIGRPTAELFLFVRAATAVGQYPLVPVSLAQLHDPSFVPAGSFAVYGDEFDAATGDYARWFVPDSGCVSLDAVTPGAIGLATGAAVMVGKWESAQGAVDSAGRVDASFSAPLVRFLEGGVHLADSAAYSLAGARTDTLASQTIDAFQVLAPSQTRFEMVASAVSGDSTLELWLSLPGVPRAGDSITVDSITLAQATTVRAPVPFGMLRVTRVAVSAGASTVLQRWRSAAPVGWVRIDDAVLPGPLAICGWMSGRFSFTAAGTDSATPPAALGTLAAQGRFATRVTILTASDTLIDQAQAGLVSGATLRSTRGITCQS